MTLETWLLFVPAAFALNLAPGPNNLLAMSNSARFGLGRAVIAGSGRLVAFAAMIALTAVGLGMVLATSELAFQVIKWVGAGYLIYLGIKLWRAPVDTDQGPQTLGASAPLRALMRQEGLVAAGNPKAILIFTAFFPQFIAPGETALTAFTLMGATFLVLELIALAIYAVAGRQLGQAMRSARGRRLFNRVSGGLIGAAGVALLFSRREAAV